MPDALESLATQITDTAGNEFNPEVHITRKDGTPSYTKNGNFRRKRKVADSQESEIEIANESIPPAYAEMGMVMSQSETSLFTMLFGMEWQASQQENQALADAWAKYFEITGVSQFPPWVMLAMVHTGYIGKRLVMPETKTRIQRIVDWYKRKRYARTNSGNDFERQNHAGEESSKEL